MIEFEIKPQYYKEIHNTIFAVDDECKLRFMKSGIKATIVDSVDTLLASVTIPKKVFENYTVISQKEMGYSFSSICMNTKLNHKFKIVQITEDNILTLHHDIFVDIISLPRVDRVHCLPKIPLLDLKCCFELDTSLFKKIVKRGTNGVLFNVCDSQLMCSESNWTTEPIEVNTSKLGKSEYSINYLADIAKAISNTVKSVKMSLDIDSPCTIEYNICDGMVPVKYMLAPRIESE